MSLLRNLVLGNATFDPSVRKSKLAYLRGKIILLSMGVGIIYTVVDSIYGYYQHLPFYGGLFSFLFVAFGFNRKGRYRLATSLLLLAANGIIYLFASAEPAITGVIIYFFSAALTSMILFDDEDRVWSYAFVAFSYALFILAYVVDFSFVETQQYSDSYVLLTFIVNYSVALLTCILIILFLKKTNQLSEDSLRANEQRLVELSNALRKSQQRFELAMRGSDAGIYEWNIRTGESFLSPRWKHMLGYADSELDSLTIESYLALVYDEDRPFVHQEIMKKLNSRDPYQKEFRIRKKNGDIIWVYDSGISKWGDDDKIDMIVGSFVDITERKLAEERLKEQNDLLEKANQELDRFVYSASHDLRAPLSSLLGLMYLAEKTDSVEEMRSYLELMKGRVHTLDGFIQEITDHSRNARLQVITEPVHMHGLVTTIIDNLRYLNGAEQIRFENAIDPQCELITDLTRVKMVLNNLIGNAIKHHNLNGPQPFVRITCSPQNTHLNITIEDNGKGIKPEHQNRVFDMFYRASEDSGGSGLGLYIVKETLEKLQSTISLQSTYGTGSAFTVSLPMATA